MNGTLQGAKDFGVMLSKTENPPNMMDFGQYMIYYISVRGPDSFKTHSGIEIQGETYIMRLDFDRKIFDQILTKLPGKKSSHLKQFVDSLPKYPVTLDLTDDPIIVGLIAKLGKLVHGDGEDFIPFIAVKVS